MGYVKWVGYVRNLVFYFEGSGMLLEEWFDYICVLKRCSVEKIWRGVRVYVGRLRVYVVSKVSSGVIWVRMFLWWN